MATVRKRRWQSPDGEWKEAWEVAYTDEDGMRRREKCCSKKAADHRRKAIEHDIEMGAHIAERATVTLDEAANSVARRMR